MATYTNYCCRNGGSNLNAGTRTGDTTEPGTSPAFTYASGNWDGTSVFTVASGNPSTDGVAVGDMASIYANGSTATGCIARVTAVSSTTITLSTTVKAGTVPTSGTGTRTLVIGGAWAGPSGSSSFPFGLATFSSLTNAASDPVRVNLKSDQTYSLTAGITLSTGSADTIQGYGTSYGDGTRAVIDGGTSGTSYVLLTVGASSVASRLIDLEVRNNGATGSAAGISNASNAIALVRCVVHAVRGAGVTSTNGHVTLEESEIYGCNQSNTINTGAVQSSGSSLALDWCLVHDNTGNSTEGVRVTGGALIATHCAFDSNGTNGVNFTGSSGAPLLDGCDFYANGAAGLVVGLRALARNCNFAANGTYGVSAPGANTVRLVNCGFGITTAGVANASGSISATGRADEVGSFTFTALPWVDAANGDFRPATGAATRGAGRGAFLQTASGYAGSVGYPDTGSCQHSDATVTTTTYYAA